MPNGRAILLLGLLSIAFLFNACKQKALEGKEISVPESESIESKDITFIAKEYADSTLVTLTLEERVGQSLMPALYAVSDSSNIITLKTYIKDYHIGGVVLFQGDKKSLKKLLQADRLSEVPLFIAIDAEWGLGMRLADSHIYPRNGRISKETEESYLFDYGRKIAEESKDAGINMVLGPVIDVISNRNNFIGDRSFGEDPEVVTDFGIAYAKGLESGGVISVAKHFPGHGGTKTDSHKGMAEQTGNLSKLDSIDLRPFRNYVDAGLSAVMAGHIRSTALDPAGKAASVSMDMLSFLLREEMGFHGLILTDAFNMAGAEGFSAADALKAGADIVLCPKDIKWEYENIINEINSGQFDVKILNDRCRRILFFKRLFCFQ